MSFPRARAPLIIAVGALALFLLILFVALPMRDTAKNLSDQIGALTAKIDKAVQMYRQMPAAQEEVKQLKARTAAQFRPDNPDVTPDVVREIGQLTDDLGLSMSSIRPAEPEKVGNGVRYPFTFRVETDFPHIVRLLYELEQQPHRLWVEGIEVNPGGRGSAQLTALIHVAAYSLKSVTKGPDEDS
jgi:hypothetical protein